MAQNRKYEYEETKLEWERKHFTEDTAAALFNNFADNLKTCDNFNLCTWRVFKFSNNREQACL